MRLHVGRHLLFNIPYGIADNIQNNQKEPNKEPNLDGMMITAKLHDEQLEKLAADTRCQKGHQCIESDFQEIGAVDRAAGGQVMFCREEACRDCFHWMSFGRDGLCQCPIRRYVSVNLGR